jgi:hypothetical protein
VGMRIYNWTLGLVLVGLLLALIWLFSVPPVEALTMRHRVPTPSWRVMRHFCCTAPLVLHDSVRWEYRWSRP